MFVNVTMYKVFILLNSYGYSAKSSKHYHVTRLVNRNHRPNVLHDAQAPVMTNLFRHSYSNTK